MLAVGSSPTFNKKAELYNFGNSAWKTANDYPFNSGAYLYAHDSLYIPELRSFFVIGGHEEGSDLSQIAKFKDEEWFDAGQLNSVRRVRFC